MSGVAAHWTTDAMCDQQLPVVNSLINMYTNMYDFTDIHDAYDLVLTHTANLQYQFHCIRFALQQSTSYNGC